MFTIEINWEVIFCEYGGVYMKPRILNYIEHYKKLWFDPGGYHPAGSYEEDGKGFSVRLISYSRSAVRERELQVEYRNEMYQSVIECIACYRYFKIPQRLRNASGKLHLTEVEDLLNSVDYSTSMITEELFYMLDMCLEKGICTRTELERIRLAYNGLSGFNDTYVIRIARWGCSSRDRYDYPENAGSISPVHFQSSLGEYPNLNYAV